MEARLRWAALGAAGMAAVALWRRDLFLEAAEVTLRRLSRPGTGRWTLLAEVVLFAGILAYTLRSLAERADPRRDALRAGLALGAGWLAEAWGTRLGLWRYYTGEAPPLWIVPAWAFGAVVIERTAARWAGALARLPSGTVKVLHALCTLSVSLVCAAFAWPTAGHPATLAAWAAVAGALLWRADAARDLPVLAAGFACVLFADAWGTTNNCWRYWLQRPYGAWGLAGGVAFGVCFDTAVVLGCLKLAEGLERGGPKVLGPLALAGFAPRGHSVHG